MSTQPPANAAFMPLFSTEVLHQYLGGGAYSAFTMLPLGDTAKILRRFGWSAGQVENKFTLHADCARAADSLKQGTTAPLNASDLCYAIQFRDADFARYTDLPMQPGCVLAFSCGPVPMKQRQPHLSAGPMVSAADLVPVQNRSFQLPAPADAPRGEFWLENMSGEKVQQLPAAEHADLTVDTSMLNLGLYRIACQKGTFYSFAKCDPVFNLHHYHILSISLKYMLECVQANSVNSNSPQREFSDDAPHLQLAFPARSTLWRYDFFNYSAAAREDYSVVSATSVGTAAQPVFYRVKGVRGLRDETSLAFESIHPIPLTARPDLRCELRCQQKTLIAELPTPGLDFSRGGKDGVLRSSHVIHL